MRTFSITVDLMFSLKVLIISKSTEKHHKYQQLHTLYCKVFTLDLIPCFWPIFVDFQNKVAGVCVNNSIYKDVKSSFMVS